MARLHGYPVAQITLPVIDGQVDPDALRSAILRTAEWWLWIRMLYNYLNWDETGTLHLKLPSATVAICTRDRAEDLRRCLDGIAQLPDDGQEVLVVDNCPSTEDTRCLVEQYANVRYVREERPGLDVARNRALREARHDVVAFIDDDAVPDPHWLRGLLRNFDDPLVLCATGLTLPLELETEAQEWFERYSGFARGFERRVFDRGNSNPMAAGHVGAGANMALRRTVLDRVGPFDEALDAGTPTHSGGDTEMFSRILAKGYRIIYDPAAVNWHRHRRTLRELERTLYGYGVGVYAFWTRKLVFERELTVLKLAWDWFRSDRFPAIVKSALKRPGSLPLNLLLAEVRGYFVGPVAYLRTRSRLAHRKSIP